MRRMTRSLCFGAVFFLAVYSIAAIQGCGKKANPVPPQYVPPPVVSDLKAVYASGSVVLTWKVPTKTEEVVKVRISRSELEVEGEQCPGCPRQFILIADFASGDPKYFLGGHTGFRYIDTGLKAGRLYTYKVILCDAYGNCGGESNPAELKVKGKGK